MPRVEFREHYPTKAAMLAYATRELAIPNVKITIYRDARGWVCETSHSKKCDCGMCK